MQVIVKALIPAVCFSITYLDISQIGYSECPHIINNFHLDMHHTISVYQTRRKISLNSIESGPKLYKTCSVFIWRNCNVTRISFTCSHSYII